MSTVTVTRLIQAPAGDVWQALTALSERANHLSGVRAVDVLTPGDFGPGTVWREVRTRPDGGALAEELLVVEAVAPHRLVLASHGVGADYTVTITLTEVPPAPHARPACTMVTVVHEAVPGAAWGRVLVLFLGGLAARTVEGAIRGDLADIARLVEPGAGPVAA